MLDFSQRASRQFFIEERDHDDEALGLSGDARSSDRLKSVEETAGELSIG
jgi:hypothetical protein